jgi:mycoredoxin
LQLDEAGISYREIDIEEDAAAAAFVSSVNGGDQTVPTVVLPDGKARSNPTFDELRDAMAA